MNYTIKVTSDFSKSEESFVVSFSDDDLDFLKKQLGQDIVLDDPRMNVFVKLVKAMQIV